MNASNRALLVEVSDRHKEGLISSSDAMFQIQDIIMSEFDDSYGSAGMDLWRKQDTKIAPIVDSLIAELLSA